MKQKPTTLSKLQKSIESLTKALNKNNRQGLPRCLMFWDNIASIVGAFATILLGIFTLCLTIKYGESQEQIKLLSQQVDILKNVYKPYMSGEILKGQYYVDTNETVYGVEFINLGGNLKKLHLECLEQNDICNSITKFFPSYMASGQRIKNEITIPFGETLNQGFVLEYESEMDSMYFQEFRFQHSTPHLLQISFKPPKTINK